MTSTIESNIWKYYLATALVHFAFFTPIIQLFFLENNLTITKIAFLGVIWNIVRMILEIPSGILADKWGRKKVLVISSLFAILQVIFFIGATNYWYFVGASIISAISYSFLSGTETAWFYDTLKELKREKEFEKLFARGNIYRQVPLLISFTAAGFLFKYSVLLPFYLSLVFLSLAFLVTLTFKEPKYHKSIEETNVFVHFSESLKHIWANKFLRAGLIFTVVFSVGSDISYGYGQIYLKQLALPVVLFGITYTIKSVLCTVAANIAPYLRKKFSYSWLFGLEMILMTLLFYVMILTKNPFVGAACFTLMAIPHGFFELSKESYVNRHTKSHHRATVGSMFSFFVALAILVLEPGVGYLADLHSIKLPFLIIAIGLTIYTLYYLIWGKKNMKA